ncbi:hypothetical protein JW835_07365 [bacterium]|nr:hypothetical protein [bacterium]
MKRNFFRGEEGFWSSVFLVMMVSLGTMALSAFYMMNKEAENSVNSASAMQVDYSATGAAYYAIGALRDGLYQDGSTDVVSVSGIDVGVSVLQTAGATGRTVWRLQIQSQTDVGVSRAMEIDLSIPVDLANLAIAAEGDVDDSIYAYDWSTDNEPQAGDTPNPDLIVENTTLPDIDFDTLMDLVIAEYDYDTDKGENTLEDGFDPTTGVPSGVINPDYADSLDADPFFYWKDGQKLPHVIYIDGNSDPSASKNNIKFFQNECYYGIFIVNANVTIQSGQTDIYGVIVQLSDEQTITEEDTDLNGATGGRYKFSGGVVSYGSVHGTGNATINVQHNPVYMQTFADYANQDLNRFRILSWKYVGDDYFNNETYEY